MTRFLSAFLMAFWLIAGQSVWAETAGSELYVLTEEGTPDYAAWTRVGDRAEAAIETGRASDKVLSDLRQELTDWRALFTDAQAENSIRINTLKTQLATLGAEPEAPELEPDVLTQRRLELAAQLNAAQLPVQEAEEAYGRADVLIEEVDALLRARQTDALFSLGPMPINPALWSGAVSDFSASLRQIVTEVQSAWGSDTQRDDMRADLPLTVFYLAAALVLLARGRHWIIQLGDYVRDRRKGPSRGVVGFVTSLGQVVVPIVGIFALVEALNQTGILGLRGQVVADTLPWFGLALFGALWIGTRLFGAESDGAALVDLTHAARRTEARLNVALLGLLLGLWAVLGNLSGIEKYTSETFAVLAFPILLATGILLVRLGRILGHALAARQNEGVASTFRDRILDLVARACQIVGFIAPALAAVGYTSLAASILFPTVLTLAVLAVIKLLHGFFANLYGVMRRLGEEEVGQALIPVLVTTLLVVLSFLCDDFWHWVRPHACGTNRAAHDDPSKDRYG